VGAAQAGAGVRVLDLFSGIGGFSLGLERSGMETVAFCEIDPFCQKVLRKHWPGVPVYNDAKELTNEQLKTDGITADVICGGFPCQPYSVAGFREGASDTRDMLPAMLRLTEEIKPTWFIGENVTGFIDIGLDAMCDDLEGYGYTTETFDIPSCVVGVPTMERHLWIVATTSGKRLKRFREVTFQIIEDGTEKLQGSDSRGYERWNLSASRVCGVGERVPDRVDRLKSLGNAVVPKIPEIIGRAIMETGTWNI